MATLVLAQATGAIPLDWLHLGMAAGLVVVAGLVSLALKLGLEKRLAIASVRTVAQLLLLGLILRWVFEVESLPIIFLLVLIMLTVASRAAIQRSSRTTQGAMRSAFFTLVLSGLITTYLVTGVIIDVQPWYKPQYMIPLLGMILGNGLTGISLCLDTFLETLAEKSDEVEMELAHGATRWEAARGPMSAAVRRGMIPIINSMMVVGVVSIPGMMTGQVLSAEDPLNAAKYQIVVMFMIAAATSTACILLAVLMYRRLFNDRHQLLVERIRKQKG